MFILDILECEAAVFYISHEERIHGGVRLHEVSIHTSSERVRGERSPCSVNIDEKSGEKRRKGTFNVSFSDEREMPLQPL